MCEVCVCMCRCFSQPELRCAAAINVPQISVAHSSRDLFLNIHQLIYMSPMALFPVTCTPGPRVNGQPLPGMLLVTKAEEKGKPEGPRADY